MSDLDKIRNNDPSLTGYTVQDEYDEDYREAFLHNVTIQDLIFETGNLTRHDIEMLGMSSMPLRSLIFMDNILTPADFVSISDMLKMKSGITDLSICYDNVDTDGLRHLCVGLQKCTSLTNLNLQTNQLGTASGYVLSRLISTHPSLTRLTLDHNELNTLGIIDLCESLGQDCKLTELSLVNNNANTEVFVAMGSVLKINTSLIQLDLSESSFDSMGLETLCIGLTHNKTLRELHLTDIKLDLHGIEILCKHINDMSLSFLNLYGNPIESHGGKVLFAALASNTTIVKLGLVSCHIDRECKPELLECLRQNTTLTDLDIGHNNIDDEFGASILRALKSNTTLKKLDLSWNELSHNWVDATCDLLKLNTTLTYLNVHQNRLGVTDSLSFAIEMCPSLRHFSCKDDEHVAPFMERNRHNHKLRKTSLVARLLRVV